MNPEQRKALEKATIWQARKDREVLRRILGRMTRAQLLSAYDLWVGKEHDLVKAEMIARYIARVEEIK